MRRAVIGATAAATLALAAGFSGGALASTAAGPHLCAGKLGKPGVLKGTYPDGVIVKGVCAVKAGKAHVIGTLTVTKGSSFAAAFARHHSSLTLTGNVVVGKGATVVLGCKVNPNGSGFPCLDDPNMKHPTLTSHTTITGNVVASSPLGVIVHNTSVGGNIKQNGGGGGLSCNPPKTGPFAKIMSPVYSGYEDSSVGGSVAINGLSSCWLGLERLTIHGSLSVTNNAMADPDAIEIGASHITKNLSCSGNSHPGGGPPGAMPVWDSADTGMSLYPRVSTPNTVGGTRSGQCVTASPLTMGGPPGASAF
jgi:hypothetical protein